MMLQLIREKLNQTDKKILELCGYSANRIFLDLICCIDIAVIIFLALGTGILVAQSSDYKRPRPYPPTESQDINNGKDNLSRAEYNDDRITRLEDKIESIEDKQSKLVDPTLTEHRITQLETSFDTIKALLITLVVSVALLLIESVHRLIIKRTQ
jgi:hypothetical protein